MFDIDIRVIPKTSDNLLHFDKLLSYGFSTDIRHLAMKSQVYHPISHVARVDSYYYLLVSTDVPFKPDIFLSSTFPEEIYSNNVDFVLPNKYATKRLAASYHPYASLLDSRSALSYLDGSSKLWTRKAHVFLLHPSMSKECTHNRLVFHFSHDNVNRGYFETLPKAFSSADIIKPSLFL